MVATETTGPLAAQTRVRILARPVRKRDVAREVERLAEAGLVETQLTSSRRTIWAATASPIFEELKSLLTKTIGPKAVIEDHLEGIDGIERAVIYGSWAARFHGEPGPQPNDIDVMVIGWTRLTQSRTGPTARSSMT